MEMIWHETIRENSHREFFFGFFQDIFKQNIVLFCKENRQPGVGAVYDMIAIIADIGASGARHALSVSETKKERVPDPLFHWRCAA